MRAAAGLQDGDILMIKEGILAPGLTTDMLVSHPAEGVKCISSALLDAVSIEDLDRVADVIEVIWRSSADANRTQQPRVR